MSSIPRKQRKLIVGFLDEYLFENRGQLETETYLALMNLMGEMKKWAKIEDCMGSPQSFWCMEHKQNCYKCPDCGKEYHRSRT